MINDNAVKETRKELLLEMLNEIERVTKSEGITYYMGYGSALGAVRNNGLIPWDNDIDIVVKIDEYTTFLEALDKNINSKYEVVYLEKNANYDSFKARVAKKDVHHSVLHVDIFPMVGVPENKYKKAVFSKVAYYNYRGYFFKKVNPKINFNQDIIKQSIVQIIKLILFPFPESLFIYLFKKMSRKYPIEYSTEVYNICGSYGEKEFIPKDWLGKPKYFDFESSKFPVPKEWDKYLTHIYGDYMTPKKENYV